MRSTPARRPVALLTALLVTLGLAVLDHFRYQVGAFLHLDELVDAAEARVGPKQTRFNPMDVHTGHETY